MNLLAKKEILIKHKFIWNRLRYVKRKYISRKANKIKYVTSNRIDKSDYVYMEKKYNFYQNILVDKIYSFAHAMKKVEKESDIIGHTNLDSLSFISNNGDEMGKVFTYRGQIYRGIYKNSISDFIKIWNTGIIQVFGEFELFPKIEISGFCTDEFPVILHTELVYILKNTVWSYAMVKDACIFISLLKNILIKFGCTLQDGHLNNITFHKGHPLFVDIGSIIPFRNTAFQEELVFSGGYKLLFNFIGNCMLNRLPSHDNDNSGIFVEPRNFNLMAREYQYCLKEFKKYYFFHGNLIGRKILHSLFDLYNIEPVYFEMLFPVIDSHNLKSKYKYNNCYKIVCNEVESLKNVKTAVNIGGTCGELETQILKNSLLDFVNCIDFNERNVDETYLFLREKNLNVAIFLYNYMYAQEGKIFNLIISDIVICIDPFANIITYQRTTVLSIISSLRRLTKAYIIVVLYPNHDIHPLLRIAINLSLGEKIELFEMEFYKKFRLIRKYESKNKEEEDYHLFYVGIIC